MSVCYIDALFNLEKHVALGNFDSRGICNGDGACALYACCVAAVTSVDILDFAAVYSKCAAVVNPSDRAALDCHLTTVKNPALNGAVDGSLTVGVSIVVEVVDRSIVA